MNQALRIKLLIFVPFLSFILYSLFFIPKLSAVSDPLSVPNNKFGIHIISAIDKEASEAATLVNSTNGDWGYVTVLVESKDRDQNKWQNFFNDLRRRHLIPIVRLATKPEGNNWKVPYEGEEIAWADFLDSLNWPVKNRYVTIYNEPNHATEWGGIVDPKAYARVLDKTIIALKNKRSLTSSQGSEDKNSDFFVLNAGFDASAPHKPPNFYDEISYLQAMEEEIPGIFNKLDGWVSHSYPNPGFVSSPDGVGRGTVRTWFWEQQVLKGLGVTKNLPVFITETGWKHAEGLNYDSSLPNSQKVADFYKKAFQIAWDNSRIAAITPFLLNYQEEAFDHFSFKKIIKDLPNSKPSDQALDDQSPYPEFYPQYQEIISLPKASGKPLQIIKGELESGEIYRSAVSGEKYDITLKFKNTGQSIWNDGDQLELKVLQGGDILKVEPSESTKNSLIEPGQSAVFNAKLSAQNKGLYPIRLQLFSGQKEFDQAPLSFKTNVQSPVELIIKASLKWKDNFNGIYQISADTGKLESETFIKIDKSGQSDPTEVKNLLPDYLYNLTLKKEYYQGKTVKTVLKQGLNTIDFDELEPDFFGALLNPKQFWNLTPFSN